MSLNTITDSKLALVNVSVDNACCSANPACQFRNMELPHLTCKLCKLTYHKDCISFLEESGRCGCHLVRSYKSRFNLFQLRNTLIS